MVQSTNIHYILQTALLLILFLNVINAEFEMYRNVTKYDPLRLSDRLKRAPFHRYIPPTILTATIIDGNEEIHLKWERVNRFLFNENLPVYTVQMNSWGATHKKSDVMKRIGKTITYYDIAQKSSVIYFEEGDMLSGVVGQRYEIRMLPMDELSQRLIVAGLYVHQLTHPGLDNEREPNYAPTYAAKRRKHDPNVNLGNVRSHSGIISERFYIETLLFITYDIIDFTRELFGEDFIDILIFDYLLQFNAVDMIFSMLPKTDFEIYINIAGIILEEEDGVFSEILHHPPLQYNNRKELYNDGRLPELFRRYPEHFDFPFLKDSFDLMLIFTQRDLHYNHRVDYAWESTTKDIFLERQSKNPHSPVSSIIVRMSNAFLQYPIVAHLIGNILGIEEIKNNMEFGSIRQRSYYYSSNSIRWDDDSISELKTYFSTNRNRCFFLNKPRSLYPTGTPVISISPCRQCTCFGYNSYIKESPNECPFHIPPKECSEPLLCNYHNHHGHQRLKTIVALDGTPCGENKVCWDEVCTSLPDATSKSSV